MYPSIYIYLVHLERRQGLSNFINEGSSQLYRRRSGTKTRSSQDLNTQAASISASLKVKVWILKKFQFTSRTLEKPLPMFRH